MAISVDYLIIGNSAAGISAAEAIRKADREGSVLIVSREPYAAYGRPLISYLLEGKTTLDEIWLKPEAFYEQNRLQRMLGPDFEVVQLLPQEHRALLAGGEAVEYGRCLLAAGSVPFVPPIEGLAEAANVFPFLTLDHALAAQEAAREAAALAAVEGRPSRCVVIGAGLIGLKAAEALCGYVDEVVVLEMAPRILPAVLDQEGAEVLQRQLAQRGITCLPGITAQRVVVEEGQAAACLLTTDELLPCDFIVAAVGVRPNSALAVDAGATQGRGLVCDSQLRTSLPDVWAAGDLVQVTDAIDGSKRPLALWPVAVAQGAIAGASMADAAEAPSYESAFAVNAVDFFDISLLTAGCINPPEDGGFTAVTEVDGDSYVKFVFRDGLLVGYILLNRPNCGGIYTAIIENAIPVDQLDSAIFSAAPENLDFPPALRWARLHKFYPADRDQRGWKEGC